MKPKFKVEETKSESGLRGWAVVDRRGKEHYFDTSRAEADTRCDELNRKAGK